ALDRWVIEGAAPDRILATHSTNGAIDRTRPLCPFPQVARWNGGNVADAASYNCAAPRWPKMEHCAPDNNPPTVPRGFAMKPLDGIRVLDFSHALAGPYCTLLLADYGAEVYKLEARGGDMGRGWGPPFAGGIASVFLGLNRGKQGISIDLKHPEGL